MHRHPSFPSLWAACLLVGLALPASAQLLPAFTAPLTTAQGTTVGNVLCATNPSIDVQGTCTATATATGWCIVSAQVDPGPPLTGRIAQPGTGGTPAPGTCVTSIGVDFNLPVVCTGQAYRFSAQVTTRSPGPGGQIGHSPKDHDKDHEKDRDKDGKDKDHGKDGGKGQDGDRQGKDDRDARASASSGGSSGSARASASVPGRADDGQTRGGGGRKDDDRRTEKDRDDDRKKDDKDKDKDKDHGTKPQPGGGPTVVFSVNVPYSCPVPL
jgi:hypothetical protein